MRRRWLSLAVAAASTVMAGAADAQSTLRVAVTADARGLGHASPTLTQVPLIHGFLIYDQLFALDAAGRPRPQMADAHHISADGLLHRITLREGLLFHDGQAVRAADAAASLERWMRGTQIALPLASATAAIDVVDERTFVIRLSRPYAPVAELLANRTPSAAFIRPERVERRPAGAGLNDATGSGPFISSLREATAGRRPLNTRDGVPRLAYTRNALYRPRGEAPDGLAGGKQALVDRIELLPFAVPAEAVSALRAGEVDVLEQVPIDQVGVLDQDRGIRLLAVNPAGFMVQLNVNHAQPPFDRQEARQALLHLISQQAVVQAIGVRPSEQVPYCPAFFFCGTSSESASGAQGLREVNIDRAQELLRAAGYAGQPVVLVNSVDVSVIDSAARIVVENLRRAGLNLDVRNLGWFDAMRLRSRREPAEQGGWSLSIDLASSVTQDSPLSNLRLGCEVRLPGWLCDQPMEDLRRSWWEAYDPARRQEILHRMQARAYEVVPHINAGQFRTLAAHRATIEGLRPTTVLVFWGVTKR